MENKISGNSTNLSAIKIALKQEINDVVQSCKYEPFAGRKSMLLNLENTKHQFVLLLIKAVDNGIFRGDDEQLVQSLLTKEILQIKTQAQAKLFGVKLSKTLDDLQYGFKLMAANSSRIGIAKVIRTRRQELSPVIKELLTSFVSLEPIDVADIDNFCSTAWLALCNTHAVNTNKNELDQIAEYLENENTSKKNHSPSSTAVFTNLIHRL